MASVTRAAVPHLAREGVEGSVGAKSAAAEDCTSKGLTRGLVGIARPLPRQNIRSGMVKELDDTIFLGSFTQGTDRNESGEDMLIRSVTISDRREWQRHITKRPWGQSIWALGTIWALGALGTGALGTEHKS